MPGKSSQEPQFPEIPVVERPTPNFAEIFVLEWVDSRGNDYDYKVAQPGDLHPDTKKYPGAKLIRENPVSRESPWMRRIYATDRTVQSQDQYNASIEYLLESDGHPLYTRVYVLPREGYTRLASGTPDSQNANAKLFKETSEPIDGEMGTTHILVSRVFQVLPGPDLAGSEHIAKLNVAAEFRETFVDPPTPAELAADPNITYQIVNAQRSLRRTRVPPVAALDAYLRSFPTRANLDVPPVLQDISVVWNEVENNSEAFSNWEGWASGKSISLSGSGAANASASASVVPSIIFDIIQPWTRNIPTTTHYFFLPHPITAAAILAKVNAAQWPVFHPRAHNISTMGRKVQVQASVGAQASRRQSKNIDMWSRTLSDGQGRNVQTINGITRIPPTIHGLIHIAGGLDRLKGVAASAQLSWGGTNFPSVNASESLTDTASGIVSPGSLAATSPAGIPSSGLYLIDSRVQDFDYNYAMVMAEVLDAGALQL